MQENTDLNPQPEEAVPSCIQCGNPEFVEGKATRLCTNCRNNFIKYPVPLWVKAFGAAIVLLVLVSFVLFPKNFSAALALSRAENDEAKRNYVSEQKELQKALAIVPNSVQVLAHVMVATFYNSDFATYGAALNKVTGKAIDDKDLLTQLNNLTAEAESYVPSEKLSKIAEQYKGNIPDTTYANYIRNNPTDVYALYSYASLYFDKENYQKSDSLLARILSADRHYMYALSLRTITKRELNQLDSSLYFCDLLLYDNHQSLMGLSSKARTLLKQGKLKQGLAMALRVEDLDKNFYYNKATMAIAFHLNNKIPERDAIVKQAEKDTVLAHYMKYANDIFNGKINYVANKFNNK